MLTPILLTLVAMAFVLIVIEEIIHVNKAKTTLFFGTLCWMLLFIFPIDGHDAAYIQEELEHNLLEIATLWLFLMSTMTFVAYLNSKGYIGNLVQKVLPETMTERKLMFILGTFSFVFSSFADNVTATLVSIAVISGVQLEPIKKIKYGALIVFAVNSGGVSLITGDVTTLMLFLNDKVTIPHLLLLVVPALTAVYLLAAMLSRGMNQPLTVTKAEYLIEKEDHIIAFMFASTILGCLLMNIFFQIPPVLTFLFGLGAMFLAARVLFRHKKQQRHILSFVRDVEFETLLFFLGVLLLVGVLKELHFLKNFTNLYEELPVWQANFLMGISSALIDNVPLTAALLKADLAMSNSEWLMLTYAVGVGGSLLVIGSAAGIIAMSKIKELTFGNYIKLFAYLFTAFCVGYTGVYFTGQFAN